MSTTEKTEAGKAKTGGSKTKEKAEKKAAPHHDTEIAVYPCANCGVLFGIPKEYEQQRRKDEDGFYCPNGHTNYWANEKKRKLDEAEAVIVGLEAEVAALKKKNASLVRAIEAVKAPPRPHHCWLCHLGVGRCQPKEVTPE